jgi:flagellum-specific peptidoglycan hydrolase FlgJ
MDPIVYEHLLSLNRNVATAIDTLKKLAEYPELQKDSFLASSSYFREHLSDANVAILEALHESEEMAGGVACKERLAYEKLVHDPDDCYLEVMRREKERQKQGLPPLIGIRYEMHNTFAEETPSKGDRETGSNDAEPEEETSEDVEDARTGVEPEKRGKYRRQKIIARVESIRTQQFMTKQEFHTRIGPHAFEGRRYFVDSEAGEAWNRVTPQMFERIAQVLGIGGTELLQ